ncbi:MAG: glutathionylspermidine synthase family protein [Pseudomonadota bacterium]
MERCPTAERPDWRRRAEEFGFGFHTMYGEPYWDETAYYRFTLDEIEGALEDPTEELHELCLDAVARVVIDEERLRQFRIPEPYWDWIRASWEAREPSLYSRLDFAYAPGAPAKLLENNADTPTSLYESGFWQWLWLEDKIQSGELPPESDQFNSVQEKLIARFQMLAAKRPGTLLHVACCRDTDEDRGTVQYLQDCAADAGVATRFVYIEDIGEGIGGELTDDEDQVITWLFKLYPWEFMLRERYGELLPAAGVDWLEPPWKAIVSNKAILPLLWELHPDHPNLLPAYFDGDSRIGGLTDFVRKPIFAREGCNVSVVRDGAVVYESDGPYGEEGFVVQALHALPTFKGRHTLVGSWLIDDEPAGLSIREDDSAITQDLSRYLPHVILG